MVGLWGREGFFCRGAQDEGCFGGPSSEKKKTAGEGPTVTGEPAGGTGGATKGGRVKGGWALRISEQKTNNLAKKGSLHAAQRDAVLAKKRKRAFTRDAHVLAFHESTKTPVHVLVIRKGGLRCRAKRISGPTSRTAEIRRVHARGSQDRARDLGWRQGYRILPNHGTEQACRISKCPIFGRPQVSDV